MKPKGGEKARRRVIVLVVAALLVVGGGVTAGVVLATGGGHPKASNSPDLFPEDVGTPFADAGCDPVKHPPYQGRHALHPEESHPAYSSTPPTSGWYFPESLPGSYTIAQPLERIMDIPANGGIAIFTSQSEDRLARRYYLLSHQTDIVTLLYPPVKSGVVLVAWGVSQRCDHFSGQAAARFRAQFGDMKAVHEVEPTAKQGA